MIRDCEWVWTEGLTFEFTFIIVCPASFCLFPCWNGCEGWSLLGWVAGTVTVQQSEAECLEHRRWWEGTVLLWPCQVTSWEIPRLPYVSPVVKSEKRNMKVSCRYQKGGSDSDAGASSARRPLLTFFHYCWAVIACTFYKEIPTKIYFWGYIKSLFSLTHCPLMHVWSHWTVSVACKAGAGCITIASSSLLFAALVVQRY